MVNVNLDKRLVESIQKIGKKYAVERIILFGSRARGDNKRVSDIDLVIFPLPEFDKRGGLLSEFDDLRTLLKLDILFHDKSMDSRLLENIKKEGVTLYERTLH
ncbi:nucleotidyltransferase family protein [Desulfitobacterium hafniense]|uniref:nucleotidyltransferase family protein n=1 Tax=Desulfitobacterium hafniense TaxID=49338 RepID=UPI00036CE9F5|nr:nucleotidyltransferase domain-containing protein [Desulfitobacterium hafniense]